MTATSTTATATRSPSTGSSDGERERRDVTYADLKREVCKAANALTSLGVKAGDRVTIYMPMIPETVVTMLACARIGAPHNVVFCGFSSDSLRGRILDSDSRVVVTTDGQFRRGAPTPVKPAVDEALEVMRPTSRKVLVVRRTGDEVAWNDDRDVWWHDVVDSRHRTSTRRRRSTPSTRCS